MADRELEDLTDSENFEDPAAWLAELQKAIARPTEAVANEEPAVATTGDDFTVEIAADQNAADQIAANQIAADQIAADQIAADQIVTVPDSALILDPQKWQADGLPATEPHAEELPAEELPAEELLAEERQIETTTDLLEPQAEEHTIDTEVELFASRAGELPDAPRAGELPAEDAQAEPDGLAEVFTAAASAATPFTLFTPVEPATAPEEPAFDPLPIAETAEPTLEQVMAAIEQDTAAFHGVSRDIDSAQESRRWARWAETDWRHIVFTLADTRYAMKIGQVIEIAQVPAITWVPNVPSWIRGVSNLRGEVLAILDFRMFLGLDPLPQDDAGKLLVVRGSDEEATAGLVVDSVNGAATVDPSQLRAPTAALENRVMPFLDGVCEEHDRLLAVLDLERIFAAPELQLFQIV